MFFLGGVEHIFTGSKRITYITEETLLFRVVVLRGKLLGLGPDVEF